MAQARSLRQRLTRPRRIAGTVLLFLALSGTFGTILGFAAASDGSDEGRQALPFRLSEPQAGDRGTYEIVAAGGHTLDEARAFNPDHRIFFERLDDQVLPDADGTSQWANLVRLRTQWQSPDSSGEHDWLLGLVPGTSDAFVRIAPSKAGAPGANGASVANGGEIRAYTMMTSQNFVRGQAVLPCGFHAPFSGQELQDLDKQYAVTTVCRQGAMLREDGTRHLVLRTSGVADGIPYVMAEEVDLVDGFGNREIPLLEYTYRADVPYPVRIHRVGDPYAYELTSFAIGSAPIRQAPEAVATDPAPALQLAPPSAIGGPSESGIMHPYPLSQAYADALQDESFTDLRDFLRTHHDAYLAAASYSDMVSSTRDGNWYIWRFTMADGTDAQDFHVRRIDRETLDPTGLVESGTSRDYSSEADDGPYGYPAPALVPQTMPTVASQWATWKAFASPEYQGRQPNYWAFQITCRDDCSQAQASYSAGYTNYNRTYSGVDPVPFVRTPMDPVDTYTSSHLEWSLTLGTGTEDPGLPNGYQEARVDWRREGQPAPAVATPPMLKSRAATTLGGLWAVPTGTQAAAAGFGALLVSLLYWAWPAIKAGPAALFSRVREEDLLENPLRREIHQRIESEPGIHHQALVRAMGRGHGAIEHHIRKLTAAGLVSRVQGKGYTCYFPKGRIDYRIMAATPLLKSPVARSILETVRKSPGIRSAELARALDVAPATIHYHVDRMRNAGLLEGSLAQGAMRLRVADGNAVATA